MKIQDKNVLAVKLIKTAVKEVYTKKLIFFRIQNGNKKAEAVTLLLG